MRKPKTIEEGVLVVLVVAAALAIFVAGGIVALVLRAVS